MMRAYQMVIYRCKGCRKHLVQQKDRPDMFCCETPNCQLKNLCLQIQDRVDPFVRLDEQIAELQHLSKRVSDITARLRDSYEM